LIVAVGESDRPSAQAALSELCGRYWYPLYAYLRRSGNSHDQAEEWTQAFFADLIEHRRIEVADQERGRFRTFLLSCLKNFCANQLRSDRAIKRGGQVQVESIDFGDGQRRYANEPFHDLTPERLYDRKWGLHLIQRSLDGLESEVAERDRSELFAAVKPFLSGEPSNETYEQIAARLGMTASAVKVAVHRWRDEFGRRIREEIRQTVSTDGEVDSEIELLFAAIQP
jgi:RNA polymerase sigma-70 factor (ECF subfamily)